MGSPEEYLCCQACGTIHVVKKGEYPFRCTHCSSKKLRKGIQKLPDIIEEIN
jgi:DNA-directed RNA polymerase subunit RPC12/RpoP